jgi:septum formation protein
MKREIILASNSPRRRELLKSLGVDFKIFPIEVEEIEGKKGISPVELVKKNALMKAQNAAELCQNEYNLIISADTIVVLDGEIIGKPKDEKDAIRILKKLRGKYHYVFTGIAVWATPENVHYVSSVRSKVKMRDYSDKEIERYVATGEPIDKAGAYGIQGKGALLIEKIEGDYYNIVGLPLVRLNYLLNKFGYDLL